MPIPLTIMGKLTANGCVIYACVDQANQYVFESVLRIYLDPKFAKEKEKVNFV
jgi:hypothetical protein